jgi:hypothetical protein
MRTDHEDQKGRLFPKGIVIIVQFAEPIPLTIGFRFDNRLMPMPFIWVVEPQK